jgi:hypothetical protein
MSPVLRRALIWQCHTNSPTAPDSMADRRPISIKGVATVRWHGRVSPVTLLPNEKPEACDVVGTEGGVRTVMATKVDDPAGIK